MSVRLGEGFVQRPSDSHKFYSLFQCFFFSLEFLLLQSTATFSFISVLSLSLHLSPKFLSMALHFYASCSSTNMFHIAPERAVSSTSIMSTYSLSFFLEWCFSTVWSFSDPLCLPGWAFRIQMHFLVALLIFVSYSMLFRVFHAWDLTQWFTSHTYCPAVPLIMPRNWTMEPGLINKVL